jgi:predicted AAA+ superfamily ATPase
MKRYIEKQLIHWTHETTPKPIVLRGARQVGKSYIVRSIAEQGNMDLIEINLEKQFEYHELFQKMNSSVLLRSLESDFDKKIKPGKTLLFIDEIQAYPKAIAFLRYFYEEQKGLHVIAAGSLLEFAFTEEEFSVPVGRIEYWYMGPMSFKEFLLANNKKSLVNLIESISIQEVNISDLEHNRLMEWVHKFFVVGGMPEIVLDYAQHKDFSRLERIKSTLLNQYEDDFHKYRKRVPFERLSLVYRRTPLTIGKKFTYVQISEDEKTAALGQALELLIRAKLFYRVYYSNCSGSPIEVQLNKHFFKMLFIDIGLYQKSVGKKFQNEFNNSLENLNSMFEGAVAEQFIGQHLLYLGPFYEEPKLFYWARDVGHSKAEVDYVIELNNKIIPVEVKLGSDKKLKSLQMFLSEKDQSFGLRFNNQKPNLVHSSTVVSSIPTKKFSLLSLPFYMIEETQRLVNSISID